MSAAARTSPYFLLSPSRLERISAVSRSVFRTADNQHNTFGPGRASRRSPRRKLLSKLKIGKIAGWNFPLVRPQILSGRVFRQEELRRTKYEAQWLKETQEQLQQIQLAKGVLKKREVVTLKKGKHRKQTE